MIGKGNKRNRNYARRIGSCFLLGALALTSISFSGIVEGGNHLRKSYAKSQGAPVLQLQYDEPATDWESQALPMGNGRIGAMVFGGVGKDPGQ
ncbi:MAG: hypothetical protein HFG34_10565 [Eubacterium sp.]|nr:hypothetical protein [Eubacterium sp.]